MSSAYAPFNTNYGLTLTKPYLTVAEYMAAPTAIDVSNLLPGAASVQTTALSETIARASSLIDGECLGAWGTLNATVDTENARLWGRNDGSFVVHPKYWPILEVRTFSYGPAVGSSASVDPSSSCWIEPAQFVVQPSGVVGLGLSSLAGIVPRIQYYAEWTYVNGFVNTTLSASVAASVSSITPLDTTGIYPGSSLTLFDAPDDEQITVASTYVPGATSVPLVSPLTYSHGAGATVSNLPKSVKQAAISLTTALIKVRGSGALVADDLGEVKELAHGNPLGAIDDIELCLWCLRGLRQMFVGY